MPLEIPNLDDRRWEDLVAEARALIPRTAPAWTDHNVHDPGITFVELFAWLAEIQLYRANRVSERHHEVFASLAGVARRHRIPARVTVHVDGTPSVGRLLRAGTQLTPVGADDLIFETDADVPLTASRLVRVVVDDGASTVDQTDANQREGTAFLAFGEDAAVGSSLQLGFDDFHAGEPELRLTFELFDDDLRGGCNGEATAVADSSDDMTPVEAPVRLVWESRGVHGWSVLDLKRDTTSGLAASGVVTLAMPRGAARHHHLMWLRARLASGAYDIEPRVANVAVNVLPCSQQESVSDERLDDAASVQAGGPNQTYRLRRAPLLVPSDPTAEPVIVTVDGDRWQRVDSFDASAPGSQHFVLDLDQGVIEFGNGLNGRIPAKGQDIRAASYRTCAGAAGNVAANQRWRFRREDIGGATLRSHAAAAGGADPESVAELELRGQAAFRRPARAVTAADIERVAIATPHVHVARAKAIPNCPHPESITVVVLPKVRPGRPRQSTRVSEAFRRSVQRHLERHRLLCDELHVTPPVFVAIGVRARLRLVKGAGPALVIARAREQLDRFLRGDLDLSDVPSQDRSPAATACPTRWPFGRAVMLSEIYAVLERVRGVDTVWAVELSGRQGGVTVPRDAANGIPLSPIALAVAGTHELLIDERNGGRA